MREKRSNNNPFSPLLHPATRGGRRDIIPFCGRPPIPRTEKRGAFVSRGRSKEGSLLLFRPLGRERQVAEAEDQFLPWVEHPFP